MRPRWQPPVQQGVVAMYNSTEKFKSGVQLHGSLYNTCELKPWQVASDATDILAKYLQPGLEVEGVIACLGISLHEALKGILLLHCFEKPFQSSTLTWNGWYLTLSAFHLSICPERSRQRILQWLKNL